MDLFFIGAQCASRRRNLAARERRWQLVHSFVQLSNCVCACGAEHFLDCSDWNSKSLNVFSSLKPIISEGNELGVDNRV